MTEPAQGLTGTYRPCRVCAAPIVDPFPGAWEIELVKEGPPAGPVLSFVTPHRPGCDAPYADPQLGIAIRIPGHTVASLRFDVPPPVPRGTTRPVEPAPRAGRTEVGTTPGGTVWAADDVAAGQAVVYAGPGRLFVKPYVGSDLDADVVTAGGGQPILDAILDAADTRDGEL